LCPLKIGQAKSDYKSLLLSISSTFYEQLLLQYFGAKKCQSQTVTREKLPKILLYKKGARKMLMKLTPELQGVSQIWAS
jgi:hypothetical protein